MSRGACVRCTPSFLLAGSNTFLIAPQFHPFVHHPADVSHRSLSRTNISLKSRWNPRLSTLPFTFYCSPSMLAHPRIRQHVNPLSAFFQQPLNLPSTFLSDNFSNPSLPIHLDIGSGKGRFLLSRASAISSMNFLGLEIRKPLVDQANRWRDHAGLSNLAFLYCNVNVGMEELLRVLKNAKLVIVSVQFPDPHFKKRNWKRRMVKKPLVAEIAKGMDVGGQVFLQSDILGVAQEMTDAFAERKEFEKVHKGGWLDKNPFGIASEREQLVLAKNEPIYRSLFRRV